ncbi:hypothetical protein QJS10_CPB11g00246 [Acorus calamus]|uniref:CCHC-type domain-containing protein n=1 Tax=Acorus calamus TaxID=4465 RepID=A0AAV9DQP0_ACOCL|nr:hypothetical protein QJS10_CPB11g00246 [Acorus calamus]
MGRWVERNLGDGGWRIRTRREGSFAKLERVLGRRTMGRNCGDRPRSFGRLGTREADPRCFRCLGEGHWSRECREPLICRRCRETGHRAWACPRRRPTEGQVTLAEQGFAIQMGDNFNPCEEERWLRCCVVLSVQDWNLCKTAGGNSTGPWTEYLDRVSSSSK